MIVNDIFKAVFESIVNEYNEESDVKFKITAWSDLAFAGLDGIGCAVIAIKDGKQKSIPVLITREEGNGKSQSELISHVETKINMAIAQLKAEIQQEK